MALDLVFLYKLNTILKTTNCTINFHCAFFKRLVQLNKKKCSRSHDF